MSAAPILGTYGAVVRRQPWAFVQALFPTAVRAAVGNAGATTFAIKLFRVHAGDDPGMALETAEIELESHQEFRGRLGDVSYLQWVVPLAVDELCMVADSAMDVLSPDLRKDLGWGKDTPSHVRAALVFEDGGVTLDDYYRACGANGAVAFMLEPIMDAIVAMHAVGLCHNDLKGANILVEDGCTPPRVRLIDLGLGHPDIVAEYLVRPAKYAFWPLDYFFAAGITTLLPSKMTNGLVPLTAPPPAQAVLVRGFREMFGPGKDPDQWAPIVLAKFTEGVDCFMLGMVLVVAQAQTNFSKTRAGTALWDRLHALANRMADYNVATRVGLVDAVREYHDICAAAKKRQDVTHFLCGA